MRAADRRTRPQVRRVEPRSEPAANHQP
jgi:hypothetical protein